MRRLTLAALLAAAPAALTAQARTQLEVTLPVPAAKATARVQSVFADDGLALNPAAANGVEGGEQWRAFHIAYRAAVIATDSARSRVVLTAWGSTPAWGSVPATQDQVTDKTHGWGKKAWARLERLSAKLGATA